MATGKKSKCVLRPGIGLCDECLKPNWPQEYAGYGDMVCLDCLDKHKPDDTKMPTSKSLQKETEKNEARPGKRVKLNLTDEEKHVLCHLGKAWNLFKRLEVAHPDDIHEFRSGISKLQIILAFRVARRVDPEFWA